MRPRSSLTLRHQLLHGLHSHELPAGRPRQPTGPARPPLSLPGHGRHEQDDQLLRGVAPIRDQGLKHRMEAPESFISRINGLCIQMTHAGNQKDQPASRRRRKQTLRQMDRLVGTVRNHARRYRDLLDEHWDQTDWTRPQAERVLRHMDQVLEQLPRPVNKRGNAF
jgi:hypothetical protein